LVLCINGTNDQLRIKTGDLEIRITSNVWSLPDGTVWDRRFAVTLSGCPSLEQMATIFCTVPEEMTLTCFTWVAVKIDLRMIKL